MFHRRGYSPRHFHISNEVTKSAQFTRQLRRGESLKHLSVPKDQCVQAKPKIIDVVLGIINPEIVESTLREYYLNEMNLVRKNYSDFTENRGGYFSIFKEICGWFWALVDA